MSTTMSKDTEEKSLLMVFLCIFLTCFIAVFALWSLLIGPIHQNLLLGMDHQKISEAQLDELFYDGEDPSKSNISFSTKLHFFHVTNPNEVKLGRSPIVKEYGPYYYKEYHTKVITYAGNGVLKYRPKINYIFRPELSHGTEEDQITLPNIPFVTVLKMVSDISQNASILTRLDEILNSHGEDLFKTASVREWMFTGISISDYFSLPFKEIETIKRKIPQRFLTEKFGFLYKINSMDDNIWVVSTDDQNPGHVLRWNEKTKLDTWDSDIEECNEIRGTDGSIFPAFVNRTSEFYLFVPNICRSLKLKFDRSVHSKLVFTFDPVIWTHNSIAEQNCYCKNYKHQCSKHGLIPVGDCWGGSPMLISIPHFQCAHPDFPNQVEGLRPNNREALYGSHFVFEDGRHGKFLIKKVRLQLNINLEPYASTRTFSSVQNIMVPVLWFEQNAVHNLRLKLTNEGPRPPLITVLLMFGNVFSMLVAVFVVMVSLKWVRTISKGVECLSVPFHYLKKKFQRKPMLHKKEN